MAILKSASLGNSSRPRVLQIFTRYREYGGEESSVYQIGDALHRDFDVGFFGYSTEDFISGNILSKAFAPAAAFWNPHAVGELRRYQSIGRYDFWQIHNVFPAMSPAVYQLAFELGVPVVHYLHNYRLGCVNGFFLNHGLPCQRCAGGDFLPALLTACWHDSRLKSGLMGAVTSKARNLGIFSKIAHWIAVSRAQAEEHVAMGIPRERISVIPHFLELTGAELPHPLGEDVIFVGRLSKEKGVDRLLRAWKIIQESGRRLWIVGDGPERGELESLAVSLNLKNVTFTGFVDRSAMGDLWKKAACSIVPSIWKEPFGMVVLESWARSCPVVAHRIGGLAEIIDDGVNGLLVESDDIPGLASAVLRLLHEDDFCSRLGKEGSLKLRDLYSRTNWQDSILRVYEGLIQKPSEHD
jgi:glycosyltransferase involved in cell wall biosynthesis